MKENLTLTQIIKESYRIFRTQITKILLLAVSTILPVSALQALVLNRMDGDAAINDTYEKLFSASTLSSEELAEISTEFTQRLLPYTFVNLIVAILAAVFTISIAKLVKDEGMHGALNKTYYDGEIIVVSENDSDLGDVGTFSDYLVFGIKKLPKYALTVLCFALLMMVGFMLFFIPGLVVLVTMVFMIPTIVYDDVFAFASVKKSFSVMLKKPSLILYFMCSMIIEELFAIGISDAMALIPMSGVLEVVISSLVGTLASVVILVVTMVPYVAYLDKVKSEDVSVAH